MTTIARQRAQAHTRARAIYLPMMQEDKLLTIARPCEAAFEAAHRQADRSETAASVEFPRVNGAMVTMGIIAVNLGLLAVVVLGAVP
jgi:hypothetical protein